MGMFVDFPGVAWVSILSLKRVWSLCKPLPLLLFASFVIENNNAHYSVKNRNKGYSLQKHIHQRFCPSTSLWASKGGLMRGSALKYSHGKYWLHLGMQGKIQLKLRSTNWLWAALSATSFLYLWWYHLCVLIISCTNFNFFFFSLYKNIIINWPSLSVSILQRLIKKRVG